MNATDTIESAQIAPNTPEFHITSDGAADWFLKQLACLDMEIALLTEQHKAAVKRLQNDRDGLTFLYETELQEYIAQKIAADKSGRKSAIFPHGTCAYRTVPASLKIADASAAYQHAYRAFAEEAVWQPTRLSPSGYIEQAEKALRETGELLPGVERVEARESFSIRFGKGEGNNEE